MSELPKGWVKTKLGEICSKPQYGYTTRAASTGNIRFLRTTDITKGLNWLSVPYCDVNPEKPEQYFLQPGDIVISRAGSVGFSALMESVPENAVFASYLIRFRPLNGVIDKYLKRYLESDFYWQQITEKAAGNALQNVNAQKLADLDVAVAPIAEQTRIAAKLDELLAQVDTLKARIDGIPLLLKRFRQSVLAAAVSGQLTEAGLSEELGLPSGWLEVPLASVVDDLRYGTAQKCDYKGGSTGVLRIPNISESGITLSDLKYSDFSETEKNKLSLRQGDIILIRSNGSVELVGKSAVVSSKEEGLLFAGYLIRIRLDTRKTLPEYVNYWLKSPATRQVIELTARSTSGVNNINSDEIRSLTLPMPPLAEQTEIVRRVDQLFAFADQLEAKVVSAKSRIDHLTQSILAKAFRGELVPQDPNDEPASVLLERIKAQRAAAPKAKRGRKASA